MHELDGLLYFDLLGPVRSSSFPQSEHTFHVTIQLNSLVIRKFQLIGLTHASTLLTIQTRSI